MPGNNQDPEGTACAIVARALKHQGSVTIGDSAATLPAWDSLAHIAIVIELESVVGRQLTPAEIGAITSLRGIADFIESN